MALILDLESHGQPADGAPPNKVELVDCDVHPFIPNGVRALVPYLSNAWRKRIFGHAGEAPPQGGLLGGQLAIPSNQIYVNPAGLMRRDAYPEDGGMPGSDPDLVVSQLLDGCGVDRAVMFLPQFPGILSLPDPDMAAAIASACNDWLVERWLQHDRRFRAMMIVAPQDPAQAAAEIDRIGDRPGVVGVHIPMLNILMGERHFYPIYEAAQRHELPIGIHPNGVDGVHQRSAAFAGGNPTYYVEWHTSISQIFQGNVTSLVAHGVFERFPRLKVLAGGGRVRLARGRDVAFRQELGGAPRRGAVAEAAAERVHPRPRQVHDAAVHRACSPRASERDARDRRG